MGKYDKYSSQSAMNTARPWEVHPIWRGLGCLLFIIGPFIAYAAADIMINSNLENGWVAVPIPRELNNTIVIPFIEYPLNHFYASLILAILLLLIGFALIMIIYAVMYGAMGPSRYGPLDSPPVRERPRPKKVVSRKRKR